MTPFQIQPATRVLLSVLGWMFGAGVIAPAKLQAQTFVVTGSSIGGGGGISRSEGFILAGTIGLPEGTAMGGGGPFAVQGGFWAVVQAIQTPGAPRLGIERMDDKRLRLFWARSAGDFVLETATRLGGGPETRWTPVPMAPVLGEREVSVLVPIQALPAYYRLGRPGSDVTN